MYRRYALAGAMLVGLNGWAMADYDAGIAAFQGGDQAAAIEQFRTSAEAGDANSQFMLGRMYAEGEGVRQDLVEAHKWFNLSAAHGHPDGALARSQVAAMMTPLQVSTAQEAAEEWLSAARQAPAAGIDDARTAAGAADAQTMAGAATGDAAFSVLEVQQTLNRLGYDSGPEDGILGPMTRSAIQEFQADAGLPVTGEPDPQLFQQLQAATQSVREVQQSLNRLGYDSGPVDGIIGPQTRSAIRDFQADAGMPVTGEPNPLLFEQLQAAVAGPAPITAPTPEPSEPIRQTQQALNQLGYQAGPEDGILGPRTRVAIRDFQTDAGLPVTGDPSPELLERMHAELTAPPPAPDAPMVVEQTASSDVVAEIQAALRARGYPVPNVSGWVDAPTTAAVGSFQSDAGLPVTGRADEELLNHLMRTATAAPAAAAPAAAAGGEFDAAAGQERVQEIQEELNRLGYEAGPVDGILGPQTEEAIRRYQADAGLAVTGEPGPELLAHLQSGGEAPSEELVREIQAELIDRRYPVGEVDGELDAQTRAGIRAFQRDAGLEVTGEPSGFLLDQLRTSEVVAAPDVTDPAAPVLEDLSRRMTEREL